MADGKPELMYFDGPGRAQLTRLCFLLGDVEFVDTRIAQDAWPALKGDPTSVPGQLFGSLPCIQHGDTLIAQSIATACYAAELGIWRSTTPQDRATDSMVACTNEDLRTAMYKCMFGDDASKAAGMEALPAKAAAALAALERVLERKKGSGPFFLGGNSPTMADAACWDNVKSPFPGLEKLGVDLTPYPKLQDVVAAVGEDERIKAFVANGFK